MCLDGRLTVTTGLCPRYLRLGAPRSPSHLVLSTKPHSKLSCQGGKCVLCVPVVLHIDMLRLDSYTLLYNTQYCWVSAPYLPQSVRLPQSNPPYILHTTPNSLHVSIMVKTGKNLDMIEWRCFQGEPRRRYTDDIRPCGKAEVNKDNCVWRGAGIREDSPQKPTSFRQPGHSS